MKLVMYGRAAGRPVVKPNLRLHTEEKELVPAPLKFPDLAKFREEAAECPSYRETVAGVENALDDMQSKLDKLRDLFNQQDPEDDGPRAA